MRRSALAGIAMICGWAASWATMASASDDETFPYVAYVVAGDAEVRSGPGEDHYVTERLPLSRDVEVYRRDPGGWLAIRPPADSFCWIPAHKVKSTDHRGVSEVVADDAVAWMGSGVESVRQHRWQVRLERGEKVSILATDVRDDSQSGGTKTWYKIAAPAGEFRWIHQDDVRRSRAARGATSVPAVANSGSPRPAARPQMEITEPATSVAAQPSESTSNDANWVAARRRPAPEIQPVGFNADEPRRDVDARPTASRGASPVNGRVPSSCSSTTPATAPGIRRRSRRS